MRASAAHCDGAFSIDDSDAEDGATPAPAAAAAPASGLRGSVHDLVRKLEAGN